MVTQKFPFGNLRQGTYLQPQAGMAEEGGGLWSAATPAGAER